MDHEVMHDFLYRTRMCPFQPEEYKNTYNSKKQGSFPESQKSR